MPADERTELASDRTDLAEDRTLLANERTFAGWARTALAAVGIGLGFSALFKTIEPLWLPKAISTAFLLIAIFVIVIAERRACAVLARLDTHVIQTVRHGHLKLLTATIVGTTLVLIGAIWLLI